MQNDVTENKAYPLPHPNNTLSTDVTRIKESISAIDLDVHANEENAKTIVKSINKLKLESFIGLGVTV